MGAPYKVEGIGQDKLPETLDMSIIDEFQNVSDRDAFAMARRMTREEGMFIGGSAGLLVHTALSVARRVNLPPLRLRAARPTLGHHPNMGGKPMDVRLDGRVAIITGASKGLGLAMATEFAASGAHVAILARNPDGLAEAKASASKTAQGRVETFQCDVSKAADIEKTFADVIRAFGKVDILVNNAGMSRAMPSEKITDDVWQEDLDLKLFAAIRLTRLCWPGMKERKWGRIINVLNSGAKAPRANGAPTAVSRAAGMALMKVLSNEGAPHGILEIGRAHV